MPAHRVPTEILELRGAFENHPKRRRPVGPKSKDRIGEPPAHLDATEKQIWAELIQNAPQGVLTSADRVILGLACQLEGKARTRTISDAQRNQLIKILSLFGWTPADRSRITAVETKDETDLFAKFVN
jgi:phage terminase small subunit